MLIIVEKKGHKNTFFTQVFIQYFKALIHIV